METFITIATFQYPHQAYIIKAKLESEGIYVLLKDELTIQAHNFLSNAIGGVKLQIKESDLDVALPILTKAGLIDNNEVGSPGYLNWIDARTNTIPIIKNWPIEIRSLFLAGLIIILILVLLFLAHLPSKEERLRTRLHELEQRAAFTLENYHLPLIDSLLYTEPQNAIRYSNDLLQLTYHNNADLYLRVAYGYIEMDSFQLASLYFDMSMIYGFRNPKDLSAMAFCQVQLKNYDEAIDCLKEAVEINRDYKIQLASVYEMKEDWNNALKYYSEYIDHRESWGINAVRNVEFQKLKVKRDSIKQIVQ